MQADLASIPDPRPHQNSDLASIPDPQPCQNSYLASIPDPRPRSVNLVKCPMLVGSFSRVIFFEGLKRGDPKKKFSTDILEK